MVFTCDGSVLIISPRMSDGGPNNINVQLFWSKTAGHGGTKMHLCHVSSWF